MEAATDRSLRLHVTQRGQHDCRPLSLFSLSAANKLGEETGLDIDKRRFRANFYVEWENHDDPYFEFSLIGKKLKIGDKLEIAIIERGYVLACQYRPSSPKALWLDFDV